MIILVFNFHPTHIAFNSLNFAYARSIKDSVSCEAWNNLELSQLQKLENTEKLGIRKIIQQIIEFANNNGHKIHFMHEIYQKCLKG